MAYTITKHISAKKKHLLHRIAPFIILVIAVPVVLIAFISLLLYFGFLWLRAKIVSENVPAPEYYHFETDLIKNEYIQITLVEDEADTALTEVNEAWKTSVYDEETCLYRARTRPVIPGLDGKICCYYFKEEPAGVILQLLDGPEHSGSIDTLLVNLHYPGLQVSLIDRAGPFFLYNDETDSRRIKGFNKNERIEITLG